MEADAHEDGQQRHERKPNPSTPAGASSLNLRQLGSCDPVDWRDKSVTAASHRLYESGIFGRIAKSVAESANRGVQTVVKINEGVGRPELLLQFVTSNDLARPFDESKQYLERLLLQAHTRAVAAKLSRAHVHFEGTETDCRQLIRAGYRHYHPTNMPSLAPVRLDFAR
jgi:hypothetical protein